MALSAFLLRSSNSPCLIYFLKFSYYLHFSLIQYIKDPFHDFPFPLVHFVYVINLILSSQVLSRCSLSRWTSQPDSSVISSPISSLFMVLTIPSSSISMNHFLTVLAWSHIRCNVDTKGPLSFHSLNILCLYPQTGTQFSPNGFFLQWHSVTCILCLLHFILAFFRWPALLVHRTPAGREIFPWGYCLIHAIISIIIWIN